MPPALVTSIATSGLCVKPKIGTSIPNISVMRLRMVLSFSRRGLSLLLSNSAPAEARPTLFLERHGRLLVVGGLKRHLLQRHRGREQHVDAVLDDLVDRQLG